MLQFPKLKPRHLRLLRTWITLCAKSTSLATRPEKTVLDPARVMIVAQTDWGFVSPGKRLEKKCSLQLSSALPRTLSSEIKIKDNFLDVKIILQFSENRCSNTPTQGKEHLPFCITPGTQGFLFFK